MIPSLPFFDRTGKCPSERSSSDARDEHFNALKAQENLDDLPLLFLEGDEGGSCSEAGDDECGQDS